MLQRRRLVLRWKLVARTLRDKKIKNWSIILCCQTAPLDLKRAGVIIIVIILSTCSISRFLDNDEIRPVVNARFNNCTGKVFLPRLPASVLAGGFDGLLNPVLLCGAREGVIGLSSGVSCGASAILTVGLRHGCGCDCGCGRDVKDSSLIWEWGGGLIYAK